uniref:Lon N-terminal domain-containing protein n=1 Tax=Heterorhabditis bacteriophora TaxID=37862 RepID=A0A1I7XR00_HETBA
MELIQDDFFYDNSKNPFADSDAEEEMFVPILVLRHTLPVSLLPGESDRPKCHPPPPPIITEIIFTEHSSFEHINNISAKLIRLDGELFKIEREGRKIEVELLFLISQNPNDWLKLPRTEDLLRTVNQFLDVIKEQTVVQFFAIYLRWWESFLNEIHSETEYMLRCIIEKDAQDGMITILDILEREKQLTKLLIFIINEKAKLVESGLDFDTGYSDVKKQEKEKSKLKLRMALLSKAKKFKK